MRSIFSKTSSPQWEVFLSEERHPTAVGPSPVVALDQKRYKKLKESLQDIYPILAQAYEGKEFSQELFFAGMSVSGGTASSVLSAAARAQVVKYANSRHGKDFWRINITDFNPVSTGHSGSLWYTWGAGRGEQSAQAIAWEAQPLITCDGITGSSVFTNSQGRSTGKVESTFDEISCDGDRSTL